MSTPHDPGRPPVDPFDLLSAMAERDERRLEPGEDPAADALLRRIVADPVVVPIGRRTRRRVVAAAAALAVVGAGTAVAAVWGREPADAVALRCFSEATPKPAVVVGLEADPALSPTENCSTAWSDGSISTAGAPALVACVDALDAVVVVPGGPEDCAALGWVPALDRSATANVDADVVRSVAAALHPCVTDPVEAESLVRGVFERLGADSWTVTLPPTTNGGCIAPAPDPARRTMVLVEINPAR